MKARIFPSATAFSGNVLLSAGALDEVALAIKNASEKASQESILVFDDGSGRVIDLDLRGSNTEIIDRLALHYPPSADELPEPPTQDQPSAPDQQRGRGRPKLGVVAREVTLLPRHWEWLADQTGGASVTLRRLVEEAKRVDAPRRQRRSAQAAAYSFISAMAGNLSGFEEACRALFADDREGFASHAMQWPSDIRGYANKLAFGSFDRFGNAV